MILITGCTGFVGTSVVRQALSRGLSVRGMVRNPSQKKDLHFPEIELIAGSILDNTALEKALEGVDTIVNLVGILTETGNSTFENIHYYGTCNLVDAAKVAGVRRFIQMSSLGTRPNAISRYHQSKWEAEEYVRKSGLDYTIFRPSVIFGPLDDFINKFIQIIKYSPILPVVGSGKNRMQPVWVEDVAHCFVSAMTDPETIGKTYELGGPHQMTLQEILDSILVSMGKTRLKLNLPIPFLNLQAGLMEKFLSAPPLTKEQLLLMQEDNICDIAQMKTDFHLEPRALEKTLEEYN